jgi:phytanoyl-CoA hydroxylase
VLTDSRVEQYQRNGYYVARQLFAPEEIARYRAHYMMLREARVHPGDFVGVPIHQTIDDPTKFDGKPVDEQPDPLQKYPRMIHMHRWDDLSLQWLLDKRLNEHLTSLLAVEPYAVQTMLYFKPPGARGQALHQDQYYLRVQPGTCMAAWLALDDCDEENGCIQVVPGSHNWSVLCTVPADTTQSFTDVTVPLPEGAAPTPVIMKAGDVLFFNGSLVHGSFPNTTQNRFRRSLIGHYIVGDAEKVGEFYHPVLRMDGSVVDLDKSEQSTTCGIWVDQQGRPVIEQVLKGGIAAPEHE